MHLEVAGKHIQRVMYAFIYYVYAYIFHRHEIWSITLNRAVIYLIE